MLDDDTPHPTDDDAPNDDPGPAAENNIDPDDIPDTHTAAHLPPITPPEPEPQIIPELLTIRWAADGIAHPPPEPQELVSGFLRRGDLTVIGAPRAIGKSWLAANLGVLCAHGTGHLFGHLPVTNTARVLIAQGELDEWSSVQRWKMLTGKDGPPDGVAETFDRWRLRIVKQRQHYQNLEREWYDAVLDGRLEATIATHRFDVLVIDPWAVYFAGNENSNDETEAALDKLRALAMTHGLAIVILHHLSKTVDVREPEDAWRGASRLADWAATRVTVLPHYTKKRAEQLGLTRTQARRYADVYFLRRGAPIDDISMWLNPETGWWEKWGAAEMPEANDETAELIQIMRERGGRFDSKREIAALLGVGPHKIAKIIGDAYRGGLIEPATGSGRGDGFQLTVPGSKLLEVDPDAT